MAMISGWTAEDELLFRAALSEEARKKLEDRKAAWDGVERRSSYHQATRVLVAELLTKAPRYPFVARSPDTQRNPG
jgi:hypothetical protein